MSTTQSLQSCLEPLLLEPRDLMHQLLPSKSLLSFLWPQKQQAHHLQNSTRMLHIKEKSQESLSKNGEEAKEKAYVHPLSKSSFLSSKSLEMCTESLGCETGCGGIDEFSHLAAAVEVQTSAKRQQPIKKAKNGGGGGSSFPPPLTSISGSGGVQVQTHREGGRLVIKAFSSTSSYSFFQAERANGRLRLSLLKEGGGGEEEEMDGGGEGRYNIKEEGGKVWSSSSRCNIGIDGDGSRRKRLQQSFASCVVGV